MSEQSLEKIHSPIANLKERKEYPLIILRDAVVFPGLALPLMVQRPKSLSAIDYAMRHGQVAMLVAQKNPENHTPNAKDFYTVGTIGKIKELSKNQEGVVKVLIEGIARAKITDVTSDDPFFKVKAEILEQPTAKKTERIEILMYSCLNQFRECVALGAPVPMDILFVILNIADPWTMADLIATNLDLKIQERQNILEASTVEARLEELRKALGRQLQLLHSAKKLQAEVGKELDKMQREIFLREQMKAIEKELGALGGKTDSENLKEKIEKSGMPAATKEEALKELSRMERMPSFAPEISYVRTYLEWLVKLPWETKGKTNINISKAEKILNEDHHGLIKVKERILEYLAVQKLTGHSRGPILCFAGPPGTGKTSLGKSIARAMGRKFIRISLGGVRDEAEIRGFRRTYVGALPGRIIQGMATAGTKNPIFMLDEIDKMGFDTFRGDPSAALLEALDPEQNNAFSDHYLEVPYDLSRVMFITTANMLDTLPPALRDRMEVIEFPGYTEEEKYAIARDYLVPKQIEQHGLKKLRMTFTEQGLRAMIREYTLEAGVRELERSIATICRKIAKASTGIKKKQKAKPIIGITELAKYLGPAKYRITTAEKQDEVGVASGLAWTSAGGDILFIEATKMRGKGQLILTGNMGTVMQESAKTAHSYIRANAKKLGIDIKGFNTIDIHVHVPQGATPKDGPSAGIAMAAAITSALTNRPIHKKIGVTGEITLRGHVLEIGGIKEKILAAHRGGLTTIIMPKHNEKDMEDIPKQIRKQMQFIFVEHALDALKLLLKSK